MAIIHFVAYSSTVDGVGIVAGAPYGCNTLGAKFETTCSVPPKYEPWAQHQRQLAAYVTKRESAGLIDPVAHMRDTPVFLFSGSRDTEVYQPVMRAVQDQLARYVGNETITPEFGVGSNHAWVVDNPMDGYAGACAYFGGIFVNNCGYDLSKHMFAALYGHLKPKVSYAAARLLTINQNGYALAATGDAAAYISMDKSAYLYAPRECTYNVSACRVHVNYHGCGVGKVFVANNYVTHSEILPWAEANSIIVLFPQASYDPAIGNTNECWDWRGFVNAQFDTRRGLQLRTVMAMLNGIPQIIREQASADALALDAT